MMAASQLFILILLCISSQINSQATCGSKNATQVALQVCTGYSKSACCTLQQEQSVLVTINGTGSYCQSYYKAYLCEQLCSPVWYLCNLNSSCQLCKSFCNSLVQNCKSTVSLANLPVCTNLQDTDCITPTNDSVLITSSRYFIYNIVFVLFILRLLQSFM